MAVVSASPVKSRPVFVTIESVRSMQTMGETDIETELQSAQTKAFMELEEHALPSHQSVR